MQLVQESLLKGTQLAHQWGKKSAKRTRVTRGDQAKTTRTEQTTKQPTGHTTKQPTGRTTKQLTGQTTKQPTATTRPTDQTTDEAAGAAATTKKPSKKVPSPWGSGSRGREARATTDRVHHSLLD